MMPTWEKSKYTRQGSGAHRFGWMMAESQHLNWLDQLQRSKLVSESHCAKMGPDPAVGSSSFSPGSPAKLLMQNQLGPSACLCSLRSLQQATRAPRNYSPSIHSLPGKARDFSFPTQSFCSSQPFSSVSPDLPNMDVTDKGLTIVSTATSFCHPI